MHLQRRDVGDDPALAEHHDPVGEAEDLLEVVGDEQHAGARRRAARATRRWTRAVSATPSDAVGSSSTSSAGRPSRARAMATSWRCPRESTRTGRSSGRWSQPDPAQGRGGLGVTLPPLGQSSRPLAAEDDVGDDVEVVAEPVVLPDDLDAGLRGPAVGVAGSGPAVEGDGAGIGIEDPGEAGDERRLAGAGLADEGDHLGASHGQRHVTEHLDGTEPLPDADRLQHSGPRRAAHRFAPGRTCHPPPWTHLAPPTVPDLAEPTDALVRPSPSPSDRPRAPWWSAWPVPGRASVSSSPR